MGEITKATEAIGAPLIVPEEGPVISRDEVVTTTTSSTKVTTVIKTRAEVNDASTGRQVTRDTTTTVEKEERNTPIGVILMETKTSESWVKAEEGTLHFIESESTTTQPRSGSPGKGASGAPTPAENEHSVGPNQPTNQSGNTADSEKPVVTVTHDDGPSTYPEQQPPFCEPKHRKSTDSRRASHNPPPDPP